MFIRRRRGWEIPERLATPESVWVNRRQIIAAGGAFALAGATRAFADIDPTASLYPAPRNTRFTIDRPVTPEAINTNYNNFFEFGLYKQISRAAERLPIRPWQIAIDGLVEKEFSIAFDDLDPQNADRGTALPAPLRRRLVDDRAVDRIHARCPGCPWPSRHRTRNIYSIESFYDPQRCYRAELLLPLAVS